MKQRKTYKFQLKTKPGVEGKLRQFSGCCRYVWNKALALQKERLKENEYCLSYVDLAKLLTTWKREPESLFLKTAPAQPLQQTLKFLDRAIKDAFDKKNPKRFPIFKKKGKITDSFRYPQGFKIAGNQVFLPKIGWVGFRKSRKIEGEPRNITVTRRGSRWFIAIQTEREVVEPVHSSSSVIGIDMGIARFATLSDGTFFEPLNVFKRLSNKLAREQRKLARKKKFSNNWHKQKNRITRLYIKIADARNDYLHKASTTISKNHAIIVLEDLRVVNMSRSAKGTAAEPGTNVKAKSGLNRSILDQGWSEFRRQLEYKQQWAGGRVVAVPPQYTSQTCPDCGFVSPDNRKTQTNFICQRCNYQNNADIAAAQNIKAVGQTVLACGETAVAPSLKQEPLLIAV